MSVFDHFAIGQSAMRAFRLGMNLAGYNVANSQTPGFSRRRIELGTLPTVEVPGGISGLGVDVTSVHRLRDTFLDFATRNEFGRQGADNARADVLSALEPALGEVQNAELRASVSNLFDALENLAIQPDSVSVRADVIAGAKELASTIRRTNTKLDDSRNYADNRVREAATRSNEILDRLKQINTDIVGQEAGGVEASDLRDERDRLLDELSGLIGVRSIESGNGQVSIFLQETGDTLLSGITARKLTIGSDSQGLALIQVNRGGQLVDLASRVRTGKLGGALKTRDEDLTSYQASLNTLAGQLITQFNAVHESGFDLDGNPGEKLFEPDPPGTSPASAIQVNAVIESDPRKIAAADAPNQVGNNGNALALRDLREAALSGLNGRSFLAYSADLIAQVGHDTASANDASVAAKTIVDALDLKRQALSGVSLDEEAANLVKWQQSFEAAAKFMQTVDKVTEVALSILGG